MIRHISALCLSGVIAWAGCFAAAQTPSKDAIDAIVKQLGEASDLWVKGQDVSPSPDSMVKAIDCSDQTIPLLAGALKNTGRKDPQNLYIANKLTIPVMMAKSELIAKIVPAVGEAYRSAGGYKDFPKYTAEELGSFKTPKSSPATSAPAGSSERQQSKLDKERPIALHDQQLYLLEIGYARLLLYANTPEFDDELLGLLKDTESKGILTYADILTAIREEARRFSKERAKKYYDVLAKLGADLRLKRKTYTKPDDAQLAPDDNSHLGTKIDYPGIHFIEAMNVVATKAVEPAYKVPSPAEVDRANGPRPTRRPTPRPAPPAGG
jgi:hypothetical protein